MFSEKNCFCESHNQNSEESLKENTSMRLSNRLEGIERREARGLTNNGTII